MLRPSGWLVPALVVAFTAMPCAAQGAARLSPTAPRVLADGNTTVKVGSDEQTYRTTVVYNPSDGSYVRTSIDALGAIMETEVLDAPMIRPSAEEEAAVQALIASDPELSTLIAQADRAVEVSGGFPLIRESGHPCDATARCVQYDIFMPRVTGPRGADRIRYVVVDLRTMSFVSRDFDVSREGNLANPAFRDESRSR